VTDKERDDMSAEEALMRTWPRLRRAAMHKRDNPAEKKWQEINDRNNFGAAIGSAMGWQT
jgi:hypothetical protein